MSFTLLSLPAAFLERVRVQRRDDQGQPVQPFVSREGGEPLRCCLRHARPGEPVALASFSPFPQKNAFKEFGPVFVHASACEGLPPAAALPAEFDASHFSFRAYSGEQTIVGATLATGAHSRDAVAALLARSDVAHVDARFAGYGCFLTRFVRAAPPAAGDGGVR
jgi:hypothetical protein